MFSSVSAFQRSLGVAVETGNIAKIFNEVVGTF
jgi:hypothetical protein